MSLPSSLKLKSNNIEPQKKAQNNLPSSLKPKEKKISPELFEGESEEETQRNIERSQARSLSRIGETVLGAPGDIASLVSTLFGEEKKTLPTSKELKGLSEKASFGYTKPQTEFEKTADEFVSDTAAMALPGSGKYNFIRNIGIPLVGSLVKEGLKYNNAEEKTQAYSKMGSMVALDLISRRSGGIKKHISDLWEKAEKVTPKGVSVNASGLEKSLDKLEKSLTAGGKQPSTMKSLEKIGEIRNEIKNGKIPLDRLIPFRKSINAVIDEMGGFSYEVPFKYRPQAKFNLNQVKSNVINTVNEYAEKFNPELGKAWKNANEASAAYSQSNKIANFIQKKIPYVPKSEAVLKLFSYAPLAGAASLAKMSVPGAAAAGLATSGYQTFKILNRMKNSKVLRKYYSNVLKNAAAGNVPQTTKNLKALDENSYLFED